MNPFDSAVKEWDIPVSGPLSVANGGLTVDHVVARPAAIPRNELPDVADLKYPPR